MAFQPTSALRQCFIKNKRYLATLAGALVIIAGLTSQHAWSGNGLPQINGKALAA
ncbi:hypothetical protein MJH54_34625, partial [Salmonella enterica subsp. enterica serovar Montevideo]|nr:hypothetical protein [Salmonella enterica subsp. enterica serovar Montevideo]